MKLFLKKLLSWLISQLILATTCWALFEVCLNNLNIELSWLNWLGIVTISSIIIPFNKKEKNNDKNPINNIINDF